MKTASLPAWAKALAPGKIEIDAQQFYPELLEELWADEYWPAEFMHKGEDLAKIKRGTVDQYWLEVAYQCAKLDIQFAVAGTDLAPTQGGALQIFIVDDDKTIYAQAKNPAGRGEKKASKGLEARAHYKRIRQIPTL